VQGAEECDDGNDVNDDECLSTCLIASCGDNVVQAGVETCDDANDLDTDECPGTCQLATCGDGFVQEGVEGCDDANADDDDGCVDGCKLASCGDGFVQAGVEICDDGNVVDEDGCQSDCTQTPGVTQVATGWYHTCALTTAGAVHCWGRNNYGQLGQGNTAQIGDNELPSTIPAVDIGTKAQALVAGENHTCALVEGGKVRCWGRATAGQLGLAAVNNIGDNEQPWSVSDIPLGAAAVALAAGRDHTCALIDGGKVRCWGAATYGQLGHGNVNNIGDNETPASAGDVDIGGVATHITAGEYHSCALLDDKTIRCWGLGTNGTLGYGNVNNIGDDEVPSSVGPISLGASATSITAGRRHTCAITTDQTVRCWGLNSNGQLGLVNTTTIGDNEEPAQAGIVGLAGGKAIGLALGFSSSCALLGDGKVRCWGNATYGQTGQGNLVQIGDNESPATVPPVDIGADVGQISSNWYQTCTRGVDFRVRCWGRADFGQLGYGNINVIGDDELPSSAGIVMVQP